MKRIVMVLITALGASGVMAHGHPGPVDDSMPDAQRIRFCERAAGFL